MICKEFLGCSAWQISGKIVISSCALLLISFIFFNLPTCSALTLDNVKGTWIDTNSNPAYSIGINSNELRWGNPVDGNSAHKSGFRFDGAGSQIFDPGKVFLIGKLIHFNYPVYQAASWAKLNIVLAFSDPKVTGGPFAYQFNIDETTNSLPCPPWQQSSVPCDDKIMWKNATVEQSFDIGGVLYTLQLTGFKDRYPEGISVEQFITRENKDNAAYLVGRLIRAEPAIDVKMVGDAASAGVCTNVTFKLHVQNIGNRNLNSVTVTDTLPEGLSFLSCDQNGSISGSIVTWNLGIIKQEESKEITLISRINGNKSGTLTNSVSAKGSPSLGNYVSDSDNLSIRVFNESMDVEMVAFPNQTSPCSCIYFNISVKNTGNCTLDHVKVVGMFPPGICLYDTLLQYDNISEKPDGSWDITWNNIGPLSKQGEIGDSTLIGLMAYIYKGTKGALTASVNSTAIPFYGRPISGRDTASVMVLETEESFALRKHAQYDPLFEQERGCRDRHRKYQEYQSICC